MTTNTNEKTTAPYSSLRQVWHSLKLKQSIELRGSGLGIVLGSCHLGFCSVSGSVLKGQCEYCATIEICVHSNPGLHFLPSTFDRSTFQRLNPLFRIMHYSEATRLLCTADSLPCPVCNPPEAGRDQTPYRERHFRHSRCVFSDVVQCLRAAKHAAHHANCELQLARYPVHDMSEWFQHEEIRRGSTHKGAFVHTSARIFS